jgi:hypothetical protein
MLRLITDINVKLLGSICFAIIFIILIADLWPFNFFPENKVNWPQDKNGLIFPGRA